VKAIAEVLYAQARAEGVAIGDLPIRHTGSISDPGWSRCERAIQN